MQATPILIDSDDAARLLSITPRRLTRLARAGQVPWVDLGDGELRFDPDRLREWVRGISRSVDDEGVLDA